ncbi:MAG TPA: FAD-dependent monooxygenase [Burkholderiales bacterium]|nr:FAD-dependent monooxygenase [Burkholderiales bacterium]
MHDVLIAGGGPVGAVLAMCLQGSGLDVAIIDTSGPRDEALRPIALSQASRLILDRVLPEHVQNAGTHIRSVHVSQADGFGRTLIRHTDLNVPALGYVFNLSDLARVLKQQIPCPTIEGRLAQWEGAEGEVKVHIRRGEQTSLEKTRLLVIADGGHFAGDDLALRDYGQTAIVAMIRTEQAPEGRAWERFCANGPLALLPLADRYALVWTVDPLRARDLQSLDDVGFLQRLQHAFGQRLGRFLETGPRSAFPLQLRFRQNPIAGERCLVVGNAAQTLHPVAGQGLNLGLRDAFELAQLLQETPVIEIGRSAFLETYRAKRGTDRKASIAATDFLVRVFSSEAPVLRTIRGAALAALDLIPPARRVFARRMVYGLRNLP